MLIESSFHGLEDTVRERVATEAKPYMSDEGIGPYEFCGDRGVHHDFRIRVDDGALTFAVPLAEVRATCDEPFDAETFLDLSGPVGVGDDDLEAAVNVTVADWKVEGDAVLVTVEWSQA